MRQKHTQRFATEESHAARLAWWAAFVATIALIAALNFVRSAEAAAPSPSAPVGAALLAEESEDEGEEAAEEDEECVEISAEEVECFSTGNDEAAPPACRLESTEATVALSAHGKLRLTLHYTSSAPTMVAVDSSLRGARGAMNFDGERKRFGLSGTFHETQLLSPAQTKRAMAATSFMIEVQPLGVPRYCHLYFDQRLDVRHGSQRSRVWVS